jgi:hypothetical protein
VPCAPSPEDAHELVRVRNSARVAFVRSKHGGIARLLRARGHCMFWVRVLAACYGRARCVTLALCEKAEVLTRDDIYRPAADGVRIGYVLWIR